jgi:hypothetical protein
MGYISANIIPAKFAANTNTTQYTASGVIAVLNKFTATNVSASTATLTVYLVPKAETAANSNMIIQARQIAAGECYTCPEIVGHALNDGGFIVTLASASNSIVIRASGVEIS